MEKKKEKAKWTKAYKKLKSKTTNPSSNASEGKCMPRRETVREGPEISQVESSSSSSSRQQRSLLRFRK
jgi:hypothetical protein